MNIDMKSDGINLSDDMLSELIFIMINNLYFVKNISELCYSIFQLFHVIELITLLYDIICSWNSQFNTKNHELSRCAALQRHQKQNQNKAAYPNPEAKPNQSQTQALPPPSPRTVSYPLNHCFPLKQKGHQKPQAVYRVEMC